MFILEIVFGVSHDDARLANTLMAVDVLESPTMMYLKR